MAAVYTQPVQALIDELGRLPGIGPKSAQRIAFHLLKLPNDDVARLAIAITEAKAKVRFCSRCWNGRGVARHHLDREDR
jgi:recombination protein RecR